jgi:hypothetical protein
MRATYNGRSSGRRGKLPLLSSHDETKLNAAGTDSASTVSRGAPVYPGPLESIPK